MFFFSFIAMAMCCRANIRTTRRTAVSHSPWLSCSQTKPSATLSLEKGSGSGTKVWKWSPVVVTWKNWVAEFIIISSANDWMKNCWCWLINRLILFWGSAHVMKVETTSCVQLCWKGYGTLHWPAKQPLGFPENSDRCSSLSIIRQWQRRKSKENDNTRTSNAEEKSDTLIPTALN